MASTDSFSRWKSCVPNVPCSWASGASRRREACDDVGRRNFQIILEPRLPAASGQIGALGLPPVIRVDPARTWYRPAGCGSSRAPPGSQLRVHGELSPAQGCGPGRSLPARTRPHPVALMSQPLAVHRGRCPGDRAGGERRTGTLRPACPFLDPEGPPRAPRAPDLRARSPARDRAASLGRFCLSAFSVQREGQKRVEGENGLTTRSINREM